MDRAAIVERVARQIQWLESRGRYKDYPHSAIDKNKLKIDDILNFAGFFDLLEAAENLIREPKDYQPTNSISNIMMELAILDGAVKEILNTERQYGGIPRHGVTMALLTERQGSK